MTRSLLLLIRIMCIDWNNDRFSISIAMNIWQIANRCNKWLECFKNFPPPCKFKISFRINGNQGKYSIRLLRLFSFFLSLSVSLSLSYCEMINFGELFKHWWWLREWISNRNDRLRNKWNKAKIERKKKSRTIMDGTQVRVNNFYESIYPHSHSSKAISSLIPFRLIVRPREKDWLLIH